MADRKISELNAADSGNLHDAALVHVVDLTESLAADQNVKATILQLKQTVAKCGYVGTFGAGNALPTGWSSEQTGTGLYTVTHNMGAGGYTVHLTPYTSTARIIVCTGAGSTTFNVAVYDATGTAADGAFHFVVFPYSL